MNLTLLFIRFPVTNLRTQKLFIFLCFCVSGYMIVNEVNGTIEWFREGQNYLITDTINEKMKVRVTKILNNKV